MEVMPTRVTQRMNGTSYTLQSSTATNGDRADDSSSGAEGRARKRFQRGISDNDLATRRAPIISHPSTKGVTEPRPNFTSRTKSMRDQKAPLGPRAPDFSPSKRDNISSQPDITSARPAIHSLSSEPIVVQSNKNLPSPFSFGDSPTLAIDRTQDVAGSFDFLPSVSFDDFHTNISSNEQKVSRTQPSGESSPQKSKRKGLESGITSNSRGLPRPDGELPVANSAGLTPGFGRSGSILRRPSNSAGPARSNNSRQGGKVTQASNVDSKGPPSAPLAMRTRRESHFPPSTATQLSNRAPRKSIGPGIIGADLTGRPTQRRRPSASSTSTSGGQDGLHTSQSPNIIAAELETENDGSKLLPGSRHMKTKSLQPTPRQIQAHLFTPSMTPDHTRSAFIHSSQSPVLSPGLRTTTPSTSASKRLSVMPPHATGLGARTISPTDARRLKRLSTLQNPPPIPSTPPTPQQESLPSRPRSTTHSPPLVPRKSLTPSSARTTPEQNRKSYGSGFSLPSGTSLTSTRTLSGSLQSRFSQTISTSRLPTPKSINTHGSGAGTEEVPPVPAIPKAYESPKEPIDQPFFSTRKSSLPFDSSSANSTPTTENFLEVPIGKDTADFDLASRQRRGLIGAHSETQDKPSIASSVSRKNLQPLRLPPLNLLPLSTPTTAKIAAFQKSRNTLEQGYVTPPPRRGLAKTPGTPMTASKANFFFQGEQDDDTAPSPIQPRSNTSHYILRSETVSNRPLSSSSSLVHVDESSRSDKRATSPYMSSLPKIGNRFSQKQPKFGDGYSSLDFGPELRNPRLTGPRLQSSSKAAAEITESRLPSPSEPDTPSSSSSLRRKLSVSWRRSSSKNSNLHTDRNGEVPSQPCKHDNMPPPRLPASATWSGSTIPSPSPSLKSLTQADPKKAKPTIAYSTSGSDRNRSESWGNTASGHELKKQVMAPTDLPQTMPTVTRTTSSILSPMQKILNSKNSLSTMKNRLLDPILDRDDLAAEEEMKKLASKRKNFEIAAREVDELRRRATPKERVSPAQALRMVSLNIFERGEIVDYKEVYFCGTQNAKKHVGDLNIQSTNFGYDDDRGDYNIVEGDHLSFRYEIVDILGKGSFGQVVRCVDHKTGVVVAIKIIRNKKRFHQQALVEVNILQKLREWDPHNKHSMVNFTQSFYFRGHLCISTELLGMNLYEFIKSNDFRGFSLKLIRRFTKQLLSSLVLLKGHRVIHCDLKPENILLAHPIHSEIKVIDFGSSCFENEKVYTYIQSRFYRSPEVILGMTYGLPIDMWSLGCILAELFTGYPIFPGENEQEQLACIMEVFGPPEKHLIEKSTRKKLFFDSLGKPRLTVSSKGRRRRPSSKSLQQALKCDDDAFLDFIARCLRWDPDRRLKPDEAIHHEFVTGIKSSARSRMQIAGANSPIKRVNTVQSAFGNRPLPEPPSTSFKNGVAVRNKEVVSSSPNKVSMPKRHSTVNGLQSSIGVKRTSTGAAVGSNLPRVTPRSVSGKPDMASAAAIASLVSLQ
ncbi:MAG: hypothetical protein M1812_004571 [Candelaria pacifica]|nr:MAG: hypothetical protein M1812_004571 [Candelaria pacifica]